MSDQKRFGRSGFEMIAKVDIKSAARSLYGGLDCRGGQNMLIIELALEAMHKAGANHGLEMAAQLVDKKEALYLCDHPMSEEAPGPCKWCEGNLLHTLKELQSERDRYKAALEWYADEVNWIFGDEAYPPAQNDEGKVAREALAVAGEK